MIEPISIFKSKLLLFIRPIQSNVYNVFDPKGLKFLTRLPLGLVILISIGIFIIFKTA